MSVCLIVGGLVFVLLVLVFLCFSLVLMLVLLFCWLFSFVGFAGLDVEFEDVGVDCC